MGEHTAAIPAELRREIERLRAENRRLRLLLGQDSPEPATAQPAPPPPPAWEPTLFREPSAVTNRAQVDGHSSPEAKIALFRSLFAGREDVYAARWENARSGKSGWSPVVVGGPANARRPDREYLRLTDSIVEAHLTGRVSVGLYPLLRGDTCRLLACDFDGPSWVLDAVAYVDAARAAGIPVALERSRSGDGAHAWMFFSGPVHASAARFRAQSELLPERRANSARPRRRTTTAAAAGPIRVRARPVCVSTIAAAVYRGRGRNEAYLEFAQGVAEL